MSNSIISHVPWKTASKTHTFYIQLYLFHTLDPRWSNWWGGGGRPPWRCQPWLSAAAALDSLPVAAKHTAAARKADLSSRLADWLLNSSLRKHPSDSPFLLGEDLEGKSSWKQYPPNRGTFTALHMQIPIKYKLKASLVAQMVKKKNPPAIQESRVPSLDLEDLLEKEMGTHSSSLAWKIPWTEEPGWVTVRGVAKSWTWLSDSLSHTQTHTLKYCCCCRGSAEPFLPSSYILPCSN